MGKLASRIRREMLARGFALVETLRFFDEGLCRRLTKNTLTLPFHSNRWWKIPELAHYACWLERLLVQALPEESASLATLEFRHERAGSVDEEVDKLHADGSYLRSVYALYGPTTIYRDGDAERAVPCGQTLLMTALDRARPVGVPCTLHRRPGAGLERAVIVCSFAPRQDRPHLANVYRQVAGKVDSRDEIRGAPPDWSDERPPKRKCLVRETRRYNARADRKGCSVTPGGSRPGGFAR